MPITVEMRSLEFPTAPSQVFEVPDGKTLCFPTFPDLDAAESYDEIEVEAQNWVVGGRILHASYVENLDGFEDVEDSTIMAERVSIVREFILPGENWHKRKIFDEDGEAIEELTFICPHRPLPRTGE